jgi:hypothetical protein
MRRRPIAVLLLATSLGALGAACSDDDADTGGGGQTETTVQEDGDGGSDTESGDPTGTQNGVVEGQGDAVNGDGTETDRGNDSDDSGSNGETGSAGSSDADE